MIATLHPSRIALVIGRKASGKSKLVRRGLLDVPHWIVWDLKGEYAQLPGARLWTSLADWKEHCARGGELVREVFACSEHEFREWCRFAFNAGRVLVVIEELSRYCTGGAAPRELADLFDRGRHAGIDLIAVAPRLAGIPKGLAYQADDVLCARTSLPHDVAFLAEWLGDVAADFVCNLEPEHFARLRP